MQSEGKLAAGAAKKYPSAFAAYGIIARSVLRLADLFDVRVSCGPGLTLCPRPPWFCREEGILGLWKGLGPNIARNALINAAELASYDQAGSRGGWGWDVQNSGRMRLAAQANSVCPLKRFPSKWAGGNCFPVYRASSPSTSDSQCNDTNPGLTESPESLLRTA
jgi:hypothetical protein